MKFGKRLLTSLLCVAMAASLAACGGGQTQSPSTAPDNSTDAPAAESVDSPAESTTEAGDSPTTLRIVGPGLFSTVTETGSMDLVSGVQRPGYEVVVERWNELHPDVALEIETSPWDNWKAVLQTAALSGDVDVLLHGSSITEICTPIDEYLAASPELEGKYSMLAMRRTQEGGDFSQYVPYGMTITCNPLVVVVDKEIFENYGAALPDGSWTLESLRDAAAATTGTDPVTGEATYGMSMIKAADANKNYIWASRAHNASIITFGQTLRESTVDFNNDKTKEVLNYINSLYPYHSPDYLEGLDLGVTSTADNNIAMFITEDANQEYNKIQAAGLLDRFMFLPLPNIVGGQHDGMTSSHMGDWNIAICNTSDKQDLAWEFIKFMFADEVVMQWLVDCNTIPNNLDALPYLKDAMLPEYFGAIEQILTQQPLEFSASTNDCYDSSNFNTLLSDITNVVNEMFVGNMNADQAAEYVQNNLDEFMNNL